MGVSALPGRRTARRWMPSGRSIRPWPLLRGVVIPVDYNIFEVGSGADPNRLGMRTVWNLVKQEEGPARFPGAARIVGLGTPCRW